MLELAHRPRAARLRVLQLGPLYENDHLRRWSDHALAIGCTVYAAGHVRPGCRCQDLSSVTEAVELAPESVYEGGAEAHVSWLCSVLDRLEPDLIHAHFLSRWPYIAALAGRRPLIATPWGWDLYDATGEDRRRADHVLERADVVVARSPYMQRELLRRGVPAERIELLDIGVDLERFSPAPEPVDAGPPVIFSFRGTPPSTEPYNLDLVLEAFRAVRRRLPNATPGAPARRRSPYRAGAGPPRRAGGGRGRTRLRERAARGDGRLHARGDSRRVRASIGGGRLP